MLFNRHELPIEVSPPISASGRDNGSLLLTINCTMQRSMTQELVLSPKATVAAWVRASERLQSAVSADLKKKIRSEFQSRVQTLNEIGDAHMLCQVRTLRECLITPRFGTLEWFLTRMGPLVNPETTGYRKRLSTSREVANIWL